MTEPTSQAAPEELVTPTGVDVPETAATGSQGQESQQEHPLTREQVLHMIRSEAGRIAEKQVTQGEGRIQKLIQEKFKALETTKDSLGLSPEQVTQAKQKIVTDAYSEEADQQTPETTPQTSTSPDVDQAIQYMNAQIANVFEAVGTAVTKADPEFKALQAAVDASWNDPKGLAKIIIAAQSAATAKAARLQRSGNTAAARVVGGGGERTPSTPKLSASQKLSQGLKGPFNQGPPPDRTG